MASMRYRIMAPGIALGKRGHEVKIVDKLSGYGEPIPDWLIFSKHFNKARDLDMAYRSKDRGQKIVFDICDNHFQNQSHGRYYGTMTELADVVTCNTPVMKEVIKDQTKVDAIVVDDPYDLEEREAKFIPNQDPIRILWYGHFTNLDTLHPLIIQLNQLTEQIELVVISNHAAMSNNTAGNCRISYESWSTGTMRRWLDWCNFITIPTILGDPKKMTKSHNRVTDGIRSGRFVLAHPLPSYERYRDKYAWVGEDLADGIVWADENPDLALSYIKEGQEYIRENLSPDKIAQQWEKALGR